MLRSLSDEDTRVQCPLGSGRDQLQVPLLLLDLIDLEAGQPGMPGSLDAEASRASFLLLPDPAVPDRVFVRSATAAWSVCLTWLPALTSWLSEGITLMDTRQPEVGMCDPLESKRPLVWAQTSHSSTLRIMWPACLMRSTL